MNEIQDSLLNLLPSSRKTTLSGWLSFNAVCCHHNGDSRDTRSRGGMLPYPDGGFRYNCFNCGFSAGWVPGKLLSENTKKLFKWVGLSDLDIGKLNLLALKIKDAQPVSKKELSVTLQEIPLPENCLPINTWIENGAQDEDLLNCIKYIVDERKMGWDWYNWHWSPAPGFRDRVILPFYQNRKIVGYTGRKIKEGKPKYLSHSQPACVFNIDAQTYDRKFVIVVEGQFDAIAIDGVAIMHNTVNDAQAAKINSLGKEVIVVPDRDAAGSKIIEAARNQKWSVSLPPWEDDIKDVADAVKKYGRLYTLSTILHYRVTGDINLHLLEKKLKNVKK